MQRRLTRNRRATLTRLRRVAGACQSRASVTPLTLKLSDTLRFRHGDNYWYRRTAVGTRVLMHPLSDMSCSCVTQLSLTYPTVRNNVGHNEFIAGGNYSSHGELSAAQKDSCGTRPLKAPGAVVPFSCLQPLADEKFVRARNPPQRSPTMIDGALVFARGISGSAEVSATRRFSTPRTRSFSSRGTIRFTAHGDAAGCVPCRRGCVPDRRLDICARSWRPEALVLHRDRCRGNRRCRQPPQGGGAEDFIAATRVADSLTRSMLSCPS